MNRPLPALTPAAFQEAVQVHPVPSLERRRLRTYIAVMAGDFAILFIAFALAGLLYTGFWWEARALMQAQLLLPVFYTMALYGAAYSVRVLEDWRFGARQAVLALLIGAALLNFIAFYLKTNATFSRVTFTLGLIFAAIFLTAARLALVRIVAIVWDGKVRNELVLQDGGPAFSMDGARVIDVHSNGLDPDSDDPFLLDRIGTLLRNQDKVVVSCPLERREAWAFLLKSSGLHGEIISENAHDLGVLGIVHYDAQARTALVISTGPLGLRARAVKRAFDIGFSAVSLLLFAPFMLVIALLIRLGDGGPALFVQRRMGRGNTFFRMLKFRTMRQGASDHAGHASTARDDERITPIGRFLRRTSLDELPQLWNVLKGEMSIVGPRPHALGSRANNKLFWEVDEQYWKRHALKPGLTGLAQVRGQRGNTEEETDLTDRLQSDLEYMSGWSLQRDIGIIVQTLRVLRHHRAY